MSPQPGPRLSRRAACAGLVGGTTLLTPGFVGCDLVADEDPARTSPSETPESAPDADAALVTTVVDELDSMLALVTGVLDRHGNLGPALADLRRLHRAHLTALDAQPGAAVSRERLGRVQEALALVRRRELGLQRRLADHAVAAQGGRLAQLLASMSAAVAQHLTVVPTSIEAAAR